MYILHINYNVNLAPCLDYEILSILNSAFIDIDLMRDDAYRDIYLYFESEEDLDKSWEKLMTEGCKKIEYTKDKIALLDLINIFKYKQSAFFQEKLKLRKKINEILIKHKILGEDE